MQFDLAPRERLLWSGTPRQGLMLRADDALMIPFSLVWGGFAVFWESQVWRMHAPGVFKLWGIPFVCVGLYITVGRFFYDAWRRSRTAYGVTTQRVLIASGGVAPALKSLDLGTLPSVSLSERPDGSGTITFGPADERPMWMRPRGQAAPPMFEASGGAKGVYDTILTAQRDARGATA
jgi:hypothetical protein